jgi:hypothetical protein
MSVQRRGRLIQYHQAKRRIGYRESARNFDHLALPDGQIANHHIRGDPVPWKNLI